MGSKVYVPYDSQCFAKKNNKCSALESGRCLDTACPFYKTQIEFLEGRKKARERIASLPMEHQLYIQDKYGL